MHHFSQYFNMYSSVLQRSFEDFCPKIHLCLHLWFIFRSWRIFEASKILKLNNILDKFVWKMEKLFKLLPKGKFLEQKFFIFLWKSSYLRRYLKNLQSLKILVATLIHLALNSLLRYSWAQLSETSFMYILGGNGVLYFYLSEKE